MHTSLFKISYKLHVVVGSRCCSTASFTVDIQVGNSPNPEPAGPVLTELL